jgi:hypothetical protein
LAFKWQLTKDNTMACFLGLLRSFTPDDCNMVSQFRFSTKV